MRRHFLPLALACTAAFSVTAQEESFIVSDIRLEGLQRISAGSVFGLLNVSVGDRITQEDISGIIRSIFSSDFFEDIEVLREDNVLIIRLQERPSISNIQVEGNKLIPTDALLQNMENAGLAAGQIFNRSTLEGLQLALQEQYVGQGLYGATVEINVEEQERNRVAINININEGEPSRIVHINIVGNRVFDDEELLDLFELSTTNWLSWMRKDDRYSREKINGDLERLASYYLDQGYINFEVTSTQVSVSPDMAQVYVTINVDEGDVYTVNEVELAGDLAGSEQLLRQVIQVREGQVFSQQLVTASSDFMTQLLSNRGYFFAEVEGIPQIDEETRTVNVTFFVDPGSRTYVNRISFFGNTNTVDEVLRREMRQMEGAPASTIALEQSKVRLERLGFFQEVEYETNQVPGTSDQINVDFTVQEQNSGSITGTIGYAQIQGLILSASLQQNNFLGTGKRVGVGVNHSDFSTSYSFSYFDPYYTIDGVSRGFSLNYTSSDYAEIGIASYSTDQIGGTISYGYQVSETQQMQFNFGYTNTKISTGFRPPVQEIKATPELVPGVTDFIVQPPRFQSHYDPATGFIYPIQDAITAPIGELPPDAFNQRQGFLDREGNKFNNFTFGMAWSRSTLNRGIFPTAGSAQSLSFEVSVPGSDLEYYRLRYFNDIYIPIYGDWIIHGRLDLGFGDGYGKTSQLPFFQNFYAGGLGTIRGFERNSLGPRATPPEQYILTNTSFLRDDSGNIVLDPFGEPVLDPNSTIAYERVQALDADGQPMFDETGQPVFTNKLVSQARYSPRDALPFGGNIQAIGTLELIFPLPLIEDRSQVRSSFFIDAGNVFSSYCTDVQIMANNCSGFDLDGFRYSAGIAISWLNGFAPMTFSVAKPFNASAIDETETFQFTVGTVF